MSSTRFALLLHPNAPQEFLSLVSSCLRIHNEERYLYGSKVEHIGGFVEFHIIEKDRPDWPVQIPVGYIVAIADMSKHQAVPGFLSGSK